MTIEDTSWIDYNGHLNMAYYNVLFDRAGEFAFREMRLGGGYAAERKLTTFTAEAHVCYVRELHLEDDVYATLQLLDFDQKRLHLFQELYHADGWLSATSEQLCLHIDMTGPHVAPFPDDILSELDQVLVRHSKRARPVRAGKHIAIKRK